MTALADITKALGTMPPVEGGKQRFIIVGIATMRALQCETEDHIKPKTIGNKNERFSIVETDTFDGWTIVDRAVVEAKGGGKWPPIR